MLTTVRMALNKRSDLFIRNRYCTDFVAEARVTINIRIERARRSDIYSARRATIGSTRVARRAGTKHEVAATAASKPATAV